MHELAICDAIATTASKHAGGRPVSRVTVRVGYLRQVVPDALLFSWELVSASRELEGAELVVEQIPAVVLCHDCGEETALDLPILSCGACGGFEVKLLGGDELLVASIDMVDA